MNETVVAISVTPEAEAVASDVPSAFGRLWPGLTAFVAAVGAIGGAVLYLVGHVASQAYVRSWGLDAGLLHSPTDETVVLGYAAFVSGVARAYLSVVREYWVWLLAYACVIWVVAIGVSRWPSAPERWLLRLQQPLKPWGKAAAMLLTAVGLVVALPVVMLVGAVSVLALPLTAADSYGTQLAADRLTEFKRGCDDSFVVARCLVVIKTDRVVAQGFLVASSERHVAVFEPATGSTVLLEREGLTLRSSLRGGSQPRVSAPQD